jgi:hypothetical protein
MSETPGPERPVAKGDKSGMRRVEARAARRRSRQERETRQEETA